MQRKTKKPADTDANADKKAAADKKITAGKTPDTEKKTAADKKTVSDSKAPEKKVDARNETAAEKKSVSDAKSTEKKAVPETKTVTEIKTVTETTTVIGDKPTRKRRAADKKPAVAKRTPEAKQKRKKRRRIILLSILVLLIGARIALPYVVLHFANKKLASMDGYYGHIEDIDISLYKGAYQIKKLYLKKIDKKDTVDFLYLKYANLGIEWKPIFNGEIVGKVMIDSSTIIITKEKNDIGDIAKDTADFRRVLNSFMPITLNKLEMKNSYIHYVDPFTSPKLDMQLTQLEVTALNLINGYDSSSVLPATITATGNVYGGKLKLNMKWDPFAKQPKFDMDTRLEHTNMAKLNDFLRAYANVDVNKGDFGVYLEIAAKDGKFDGYIKPVIKDLDVVTWKKEEGNLLQIAYETLIGTAAWVFKNHVKDQQATKIYISGELKNPHFGIGGAIVTLLRNAFITALKPNIDSEINLSSVNKLDEDKNVIDKFLDRRKERKEAKEKRKQND